MKSVANSNRINYLRTIKNDIEAVGDSFHRMEYLVRPGYLESFDLSAESRQAAHSGACVGKTDLDLAVRLLATDEFDPEAGPMDFLHLHSRIGREYDPFRIREAAAKPALHIIGPFYGQKSQLVRNLSLFRRMDAALVTYCFCYGST